MRMLKTAGPLAALCLSAGIASAGTGEAVVKVYSLDVAQRMQNLELIDVTAEKPAEAVPAAAKAGLEPDLLDILADIEDIEQPSTER